MKRDILEAQAHLLSMADLGQNKLIDPVLKVCTPVWANVPEDRSPRTPHDFCSEHMTKCPQWWGFPVTNLSQRWLIIPCDSLAQGWWVIVRWAQLLTSLKRCSLCIIFLLNSSDPTEIYGLCVSTLSEVTLLTTPGNWWYVTRIMCCSKNFLRKFLSLREENNPLFSAMMSIRSWYFNLSSSNYF